MRLRIRHETSYRYRLPVALLPHRLMLVPRSGHDVRVLGNSLEMTPGATVDWAQDVFDNMIASATFTGSTDRLTIVSDIEVELTAPAWPVLRIAPGAHSYPFAYAPEEVTDLGALREPQFPEEAPQISSWTQDFVAGPATDTLSLLKDINTGIGKAIGYRVREEEGTQTPSQTLSLASGSCRDMSALFIEAVRHLGFGARAVSGYLYDPDEAIGIPGSTHAWAEVFLPAAGWIAFDPTHGSMGSSNLVPVSVGRCNAQIAPVTGGYIGVADAFAGMTVEVRVTSR